LAFWINAYNAFTIQSILDHYPIKSWTIKGLLVPRNSIIQIPGVWKKLKWEVAGQNLTLDHIEHGLLRPVFREPRIHFAIVCASIGCPDLRSEAYTFDKLEQQLKDQTRRFLLNPEKGVRFDYEGRKICVSQLFRWFSEDFPGKEHATPEFGSRPVKERNILQFISGYLTDPEQQTLISDPEVDLDYLPYDWTLNELPASDVPA
ncbi:MAG: DUF547 domain-containing protein, partial [Verrucomicrobiae bacterium]|nr:DUF547 domain-containing protein [Verrucomicrobiae bacterium]